MYLSRTIITLLIICVFSIERASADEIIVQPITTYHFFSGTEKVYSSMEDLIQNFNSASEISWNNCLTVTPNHCGKAIISGYFDRTSSYINGLPTAYTLRVLRHSVTTTGSNIVDDPDNYYSATVGQSCPPRYTAVTSGSPDNKTMECKYVEPSSCPKTGNPINIGTGAKEEVETDFETQDGILKVQRHYIDQFKGWSLDAPSHLSYIEPNTYQQIEFETLLRARRYSLIIASPFSDQNYFIKSKHRIKNTSNKNSAYLFADNKTLQLLENDGVFTGNAPQSRQIQLRRIIPVNNIGASWKLVEPNGNVSFFSDLGQLLKTEFIGGGFLSYAYSNNRLQSKTDHFGRSLVYKYDTKSRLISITLPDEQSINYEYGVDESSSEYYLLKKVTWPNGESVSYLYNEEENINGANSYKMLTGKLNADYARVGTYKYTLGKATYTEGALGSLKRILEYSYLSTKVSDAFNNAQYYSFIDSIGTGSLSVTSTSQPAGSGCAAATKSATYYTDGLKKTETNFNGHKTQLGYDATRALETIRVEGIPTGNGTDYLPANTPLVAGARKITTQWHSQHRKPVKKSEPKLITTFIYNGDADPFNSNQIANCAPTSLPLLCHKVQQATTDSNGATGVNAILDYTLAARHEFYTYNARGQQLTFARAATGTPNETREYYESTTTDWTLGDLKQTSNALGHTTQFTRYDRNGRLLGMLDANNVGTEFRYDARGRVLSQTIAGAATTHTYDLNGNRIGSILPNGVTMIYHYDLAKRLIAVENSLGEKINYEYDVESNLRFERITNASNVNTYTKEHVYDALSRVQNTLNSNNQGSTYLYDAKGNLTGEVDANTKTTSHTIDPLDRLTQTTNAVNDKTDFNYDAQGNLTQVKDARNNATTYIYSAFGDLVSQTSPDTGTTTFTYDAAGNRLSQTDARGVVTNYTYDALNRIKTIKYPAASAENLTFTYDSSSATNKGIGRLSSINKSGVTTAYAYNFQGLVSQQNASPAGVVKVISYTYDTSGNLTRIVYPSGRSAFYTYDNLGRLSTITTKIGSGATQTLISNTGYLPFGPATTYKYGNNLVHDNLYDQDYRLTNIKVGGLLNRTYGYDPVDNITSIMNSLNNTKSQSFSYDELNRLITANGGYGNLGYGYDAVGNRLSETRNGNNNTYQYAATSNRLTGITRASGNRNFTYDAAGNPIQRTADDNSTQTYSFNKANRLSSVSVNGTPAATYTYNPLGQRVSKTLPNGSKELYYYDESGQLIAVLSGTGATLREYIYWGNQQIALVNNGTTYYIHNDHLNTPQVITNQSQQVVWMGDYEPFGKVASNASNSIEVFSRFPGQYLDGETGLYYNYFRDYDPSIGRYIESDPIGLGGGINTYGYAYQNPITNYDPDGRFVFLLAIPALGGGVSGGTVLSGGLALSFAAWSSTWDYSERTPEEDAQADFDHDYYKNVCEQKPPPSGDKCQDILNEANRAQLCSDLMTQFDKKWSPGRHASDALREQARAHRLRKEYEQCKKDECP